MQLHSAIDQPNLTNIHSLLEHPEVAVGFRLQKNKLDVVRELTAGRIHGTFDTLAPCDFNCSCSNCLNGVMTREASPGKSNARARYIAVLPIPVPNTATKSQVYLIPSMIAINCSGQVSTA